MPEAKPTMAPFAAGTISPEEAKRQTAAAAKARSDARAAADKRLDEDDKARHEANVETSKRHAQMKPTPTQRENDLAKLGLLDHDEKEDDGSGPEEHPNIPRALSADDRARYKTRNLDRK